MQKTTVGERLEKALHDLHAMRSEHTTVCEIQLILLLIFVEFFLTFQLSEYLVRMSRALAWSECTAPPAPGADTTLLAETLLERAERLVAQHDHHHAHGHPHPHAHAHAHTLDHKHWDNLHPHHHFKSLKLRRERSCHDLPVKESTAMYNLQRRVHALKDQIQKKDLQIELLKRKLALCEEGARGKCIIQVRKCFD